MKRFCTVVAAVVLAILMPACGKSGSKHRAASIAATKVAVTVNELKMPVKTAKGVPVRIFEVTPEMPATVATGNLPRGAEPAKASKSLVAVVGSASVAVEIPDASIAMVGGKKVQLNLTMIGPAVVLISAASPEKGCVVPGIPVEEAMKKIASGTLDVPAADTLP